MRRNIQFSLFFFFRCYNPVLSFRLKMMYEESQNLFFLACYSDREDFFILSLSTRKNISSVNNPKEII